MPQAAIQSDDDEMLMPLSEVLVAVAAELELVRSLGWRIERAVCVLAVRAGAADEIIGELQNMDAMLQQIAALHDFLLTLSGTQGQPALLSVSAALQRLTLRDVKARLVGGSWSVPPSGAMEVF
jgi:hypothetical protein